MTGERSCQNFAAFHIRLYTHSDTKLVLLHSAHMHIHTHFISHPSTPTIGCSRAPLLGKPITRKCSGSPSGKPFAAKSRYYSAMAYFRSAQHQNQLLAVAKLCANLRIAGADSPNVMSSPPKVYIMVLVVCAVCGMMTMSNESMVVEDDACLVVRRDVCVSVCG